MNSPITEADSQLLVTVIAEFELDAPVVRVQPFGAGLINKTLRLDTVGGHRYVLQCLNATVFPRPVAVMQNQCRVLQHLRTKGRLTLELIGTRTGEAWTSDVNGQIWRCYRYIGNSRTYTSTGDPAIVLEAARAFGQFTADLADLPGPPLHAVIPGFHDTPTVFRSLLRAVREDALHRAAATARETEALLSRRELSELFLPLSTNGELPRRNVHNDTKLGNILFHGEQPEALCVIDLDTVMPGLILHDIGDMVRSAASTRAESEYPTVDLVLLASLADGYLSALGEGLTPAERRLIPDSPRVITLELALRFLVDHLRGDRYFRIDHPGQNLERCRSQLALLADMDAKADRMRDLWEAARGH